jgi:CBS domain-containing protein
MKARDVMTTPVIAATPDTPVRDVAQLLLDKRISGLPIVQGDRVVGILSESDLLRRVEAGTEPRRSKWLETLIDPSIQAADFAQSRGVLARDVMSRDVIWVDSDSDLREIARVFEQRRIKRVPVLENGKLVGIISRANLLRALMVYSPPARADARSDQEIQEQIRDRLGDEAWLDFSRLNIVVTDGVVHLWGTLKSDEQRRALDVAVRGIPGVTDVQDHTSRDIFANDAG